MSIMNMKRNTIWALQEAKDAREAKELMGRCCMECNVSCVGNCPCDKGYICRVEDTYHEVMELLAPGEDDD